MLGGMDSLLGFTKFDRDVDDRADCGLLAAPSARFQHRSLATRLRIRIVLQALGNLGRHRCQSVATASKYEVFGELEVPRRERKDGKQALDFSREALADFWEQAERARQGLRSGAGCYIFGVRAGRGITPWYVGQSKGAFEKECFAYQKQAIYRDVMDDTAKGTPVLFLIARVTPKGRLSKSVSQREADFIERKLIHDATNANSNLKNIHNATLVKTLVIPGVLNSPKGKRSEAVKSLMVALGTQTSGSN